MNARPRKPKVVSTGVKTRKPKALPTPAPMPASQARQYLGKGLLK